MSRRSCAEDSHKKPRLSTQVHSPGGGATGYDDAAKAAFAALPGGRRRVVFDLASRSGDAVAARCAAAAANGADSFCCVTDLAAYRAPSGNLTCPGFASSLKRMTQAVWSWLCVVLEEDDASSIVLALRGP